MTPPREERSFSILRASESGADLRGDSATLQNTFPCRSSATVGDAALESGNAGSSSGAVSTASGAA
jgi:hypothetical protein